MVLIYHRTHPLAAAAQESWRRSCNENKQLGVYKTIVETLSGKQNRMSEKTFPKHIRDQKDAHQVDMIAKLGKI